MMMNAMGTGTGATIIGGYRLVDWASGLVLLLMSILIVALLAGTLAAMIGFLRRAFDKTALPPEPKNSAEGKT